MGEEHIQPMNLATRVVYWNENEMKGLESAFSQEALDKALLEKLLPAAKAIASGKTVAFPTETVYGIGANALSEAAVLKIFEAKGRPSDNPLIVHISQREQLKDLVSSINEIAEKLMDAFWPGPITLIMAKSEKVPMTTTAGLETVAIRMPSHPIAKWLIELSKCPIAAPSANISGRPSPTCGRDVVADLTGRVEAILYADEAQIGLESTVVDVTGEEPIILRPGGVTLEMIKEIVGMGRYDEKLNRQVTSDETVRSPGMKYTHYSPKAEVFIYEGEDSAVVQAIEKRVEAAKLKGIRVGVMSVAEIRGNFEGAHVIEIGSYKAPEEAAARLFKTLRDFDLEGVSEVYAVSFSEVGIGKAIMNRLIKAAGHKVIKV